jgi:hypothetical protein
MMSDKSGLADLGNSIPQWLDVQESEADTFQKKSEDFLFLQHALKHNMFSGVF